MTGQELTGQELAQLVWKFVDAEGWTDFARKLGLQGAHSDKRVRRWIEGNNEPRYEGTMILLNGGLLLTPEGVAAWRGVSLPEAERLIAEAAEKRARRLADQQEREAHDRRKKDSA